MTESLQQLSELLKQRGYSVTKTRKTLFKLLESYGPITTSVLIRKASGMNRASVYRTLDLFEQIGVIKRLQMGWKHRFELSDTFATHHHHATCLDCGNIIDLHENAEAERAIERVGQRIGFQITDHTLELKGYCKKCQNLKTPSA